MSPGGRHSLTWLPRALKNKQLLFAERTFRIHAPVRLAARVDRAYRTGNAVVLMELKTRSAHRTYRSDLIELSAQRVALEGETGLQVSDTAYVVTEVGGRRRTHLVKLLQRAEVMSLVARRRELLKGTLEADYAQQPGLCLSCPHRVECRPESRSVPPPGEQQ